MKTIRSLRALSLLALALALATPVAAQTPDGPVSPYYGEVIGGFPAWDERSIHQLVNRARVSPDVELAACTNCSPAELSGCYLPVAPLTYSSGLNEAARFHSQNMSAMNYFSHTTPCVLRTDIAALYPESCDGSSACACTGSGSTNTWSRIGLFGASGSGENIAWGYGAPMPVFYGWLHEPAPSSPCSFNSQNGHRWNILKNSGPGHGAGRYGAYTTQDFGSGVSSSSVKAVSGSHWTAGGGRQGSSVEFWANWFDAAPPSQARLILDGTAYPLTLARGTATNGAWTTTSSAVATGCHTYYFSFHDATGSEYTFPATGAFGLGPEGSCPEWFASRCGTPASLTVTTPRSVTIGSGGNVASVPSQGGLTYTWTLTGGVITSGQGTPSITFQAGAPGTRMVLSVAASSGGCAAAAGTAAVAVDFSDVPPSNPLRDFVNSISRSGITTGCGNGMYCPGSPVLRSQMSVFLLRAQEGAGYVPPSATGAMFVDVPSHAFAAAWIEELARRGISAGCNATSFCPDWAVDRAQMAVFLLRARLGSGYVPPSAIGIFADVPPGDPFAPWIEEIHARAITAGCESAPLRYCPGQVVTRGQMAVFLTKTFSLP